MEDVGDRLVIDTARLARDGERLEGEADVVDLDESLVRPFGGVRYSLEARLYGDELLVRGRLEQDFDLVCCRCGKDFDTTVKVEDFAFSTEVDPKNPDVDLSDELRQSVLLALPTYPLCDENCPGVEMKVSAPADDRWDALDALDVR